MFTFTFLQQERRTTPGEALNHPFVRLAHLVDYAHCNNVKASVQMMEVSGNKIAKYILQKWKDGFCALSKRNLVCIN